MRGEINIRIGALGDQRLLAGLGAIVQDLHIRERPDIFKPIDPVALEEWFRDILGTRAAKVWIAQIGGVAAGYVLVRDQRRAANIFCQDRRWYEIDQIGVHPSYQRQGIARALLGKVIASAAIDDVKDVELNTWSFNEPAQRAFHKLGLAIRSARFGMSVGASQVVAVQPAP
jgi:ribosomal protein S18 acetylase RimI-like enzyme